MPRTNPLITTEELQCLLGGGASGAAPDTPSRLSVLQLGLLLWGVKSLVFYGVFLSPEVPAMAHTAHYLWLRGALEMLCLAVFGWATQRPRHASVARGAVLIACTTLVMDVLSLVALP